jgi:hypothetical protein
MKDLDVQTISEDHYRTLGMAYSFPPQAVYKLENLPMLMIS